MDPLTPEKFKKHSKDLFKMAEGCLFFVIVGLICCAVIGFIIKAALVAFSYGWKLL